MKNNTTDRETGYRHVFKYIGVLGGVYGLKQFVMLLRNKLIAILLHSKGFGINAVYGNISELIYNCTNMGVSFSGVRSLSELFESGTEQQKQNFVSVIRTWALWTGLLAMLICVCFSPLLCDFFFDGDRDYVVPICFLSVYLFTLPLEAVECSIVKAMRRLKNLAWIEITVVLATFFSTIPFYYFLGVNGIVASLIICGLITLGVHFVVTLRMFPYSVSLFSKRVFVEGLSMLRIGVPFVLAGIAAALTVSWIYNILSSFSEVGMFRQGYLILTVSSGLVFAAMESDYFPRLSSANHDNERMRSMANQQIVANLLFITPLLVVMSLFMPHLIRLISSSEFIPIVPMVVFGVCSLLFKAVTQPIAYIPLAKGHSFVFLIMELIYDAYYLALVYWCYKWGADYYFEFETINCAGLAGTGIALSLSSLLDLLMVGVVYSFAYGFRFKRSTLLLMLVEFTCLIMTLPFCLKGGMRLYKYGTGGFALLVSILLAWRLLSTKSGIGSKISKILHHSHHGDGCC